MTTILIEILLILLLILANGVFAMSEIAVVSARKPRLKQRADQGSRRARRALDLAEHPTRFLSTVQIGITLIGVLAGAYGGASLAGKLDAYLETFPRLLRYSEEISLTLVVVSITFLSLVVGELVPKRIGLHNPEKIAELIAGPMMLLSKFAAPVVKLLIVSTETLLRLLGLQKSTDPPVTEEEVAALLEAGTEAGVFEPAEHEMIERVFGLGDRRVTALMTPRNRVIWLDVEAPPEKIRETIRTHPEAVYPVCEQELDRVLGIVRAKDLLPELLDSRTPNLRARMRKVLFVPEGVRALRVLKMFRESGIHVAMVIDEFGAVEGLLTLRDVLEEIAGSIESPREAGIVPRNDGTLLIDGSLNIHDFWEALGREEKKEDGADYDTVAGLVLAELRRVPKVGEWITLHGLRIEVVDMDGYRIDKLLVSEVEDGNGA